MSLMRFERNLQWAFTGHDLFTLEVVEHGIMIALKKVKEEKAPLNQKQKELIEKMISNLKELHNYEI